MLVQSKRITRSQTKAKATTSAPATHTTAASTSAAPAPTAKLPSLSKKPLAVPTNPPPKAAAAAPLPAIGPSAGGPKKKPAPKPVPAAAGLSPAAGAKDPLKRTGFPKAVQALAIENYNVGRPPAKRVDPKKPDLPSHDLAQPHRVPYKYMRHRTQAFMEGKESAADLGRWSGRLEKASVEKAASGVSAKASQRHQQDALKLSKTRQALIDAKASGSATPDVLPHAKSFLRAANHNLANVPDLGPHTTVNNPVGGNLHVNTTPRGSRLSLTSHQAVSMSPMEGYGVAMRSEGRLLLTSGREHEVAKLDQADQDLIKRHEKRFVKK